MFSFLLLVYFQSLNDSEILEMVKRNDLPSVQKALSIKNVSLYDYGIELSHSGEFTKDAVAYFSWLRKHFPDEDQYIFGKAWALWRFGNPEDALKEVNYLTIIGSDKKMEARAYYLSGIIHGSFYRRYDIVERELKKAESLYTEIGANGGLFVVYVALANNSLHQSRFEQIESFLLKADAVNKKLKNPYPDAYMVEIQAEYLFHKGMYKEASKKYNDAALGYKGDSSPLMAARAKAREGVCYTLTNRFKEAIKIAVELENSPQVSKEPRVVSMLNLLWLRIKLCSGHDYTTLEKSIRDEAEATANRTLLAFLKLLIELPCSEAS